MAEYFGKVIIDCPKELLKKVDDMAGKLGFRRATIGKLALQEFFDNREARK